MIEIRLHHSGFVYGSLSWKKDREWDVSLDLGLTDPEHAAQDLETWTQAVGATKLWLHDGDAKIERVVAILTESGVYPIRQIVDLKKGKYFIERQP